MHFIYFERNNLDVVNVFLGWFWVLLILSAVGGSNKISWFGVTSVEWVTLERDWLTNVSKSLLTSCQLKSNGIGTNNGHFRKSDFRDYDNSVDVTLLVGTREKIFKIYHTSIYHTFLIGMKNLSPGK